ncbi:hypothetical protein PNIG_a1259 [Pseudoalteromonas nigrifaciens]|uniref:Uncharacterized protein n=1 Tax=Pseudoalteromonas nigrifaciens TaxID=28109 RepID=A0AAC9XX03_9GAMM|nr:hypothetical protein PNIG_a1259 [Pseudoalteromonas nigrifaciens]GEN41104.1 hypothetical protein PNI02_05700 [Pseudoalteromonas nigrifaciens]SJN29947.1 hypothetical protein CZ797_05950 [Pseudoalteromonas sp. JB197]
MIVPLVVLYMVQTIVKINVKYNTLYLSSITISSEVYKSNYTNSKVNKLIKYQNDAK